MCAVILARDVKSDVRRAANVCTSYPPHAWIKRSPNLPAPWGLLKAQHRLVLSATQFAANWTTKRIGHGNARLSALVVRVSKAPSGAPCPHLPHQQRRMRTPFSPHLRVL